MNREDACLGALEIRGDVTQALPHTNKKDQKFNEKTQEKLDKILDELLDVTFKRS